jgi:hypothetical protein
MPTKTMTIEERITQALREGPRSNRELRVALGLDPNAYDSQMDRALQTLRKEEKIQLVNRRWATAHVKKCGKCSGRGWVGKGALCAGCGGAGWVAKPKTVQAVKAAKSAKTAKSAKPTKGKKTKAAS